MRKSKSSQRLNQSILDNDQRPIVSFFLALIAIGIPLNLLSNRSYEPSWTIGEWLISYAGGFVRRGLPGSVIHSFATQFNLSPIHSIWLASFFFYALLAGLLWRLCKQQISSAILLSPMILLGPIIGNYFVRKDTMILVFFGLCLLAIQRFESPKKPGWPGILLINATSIAAILSHESYGIWAIPSLFLSIVYMDSKKHSTATTFEKGRKAVLHLLPSILAFFTCLIFKGSGNHALAIHESWQELGHLIPSKEALLENSPLGAIDAIGWSTIEGLGLSISTLNNFNYLIWIPAAWLITIYLCIQLFIADKNPQAVIVKRLIVLFQFLVVSPLFFLGWDFGRWIFIWMTSSALLYGFLSTNSKMNILDINELKSINELAAKLNPGLPASGNRKLMLLFFGIPECCWTLKSYIASTPIGFIPASIAKGISF